MSVNLEIKGSLAKLLATENIMVEHRKVDTASFDVFNRILTLPMWEKASSVVYDLLVGHEVGHALYTPNRSDWKELLTEIPQSFINVVEDARVERLMKKKYAGISRSFFSGYKELHEDDFFSVGNTDLNSLNFIDRINLYFKVGAFLNISFNEDEDEFISRIAKAETFDDVLEICRDLVKYLKVKKIKVSLQPIKTDMNGEDGQENQSGDSDVELEEIQVIQDNSESKNSQLDESLQEGNYSNEEDEDGSGKGADEFNSTTDKSLSEKLKDLIDPNAKDLAYVELPDFDLDTLILPNNKIHDKISKHHFNIDTSDSYAKYKKESRSEVAYMVKEFECKKAADQYARSSINRTGVLDTSRLHTYRYSDDIFKKISVVPDGKSHGLIFILDWSGSMCGILMDTIKQLYSLIWFCKKCNIPFDVYAFTDSQRSYVDLQKDHPYTYKRKDYVIEANKSFRLFHFFTSSVSNMVLETQMKNIWKVAKSMGLGGDYPKSLALSGTPLAESIMALHKLIPSFNKKTRVQKTHVVFLTDGDGCPCNVLVKNSLGNFEKQCFYKTVLRNKGATYPPYGRGYFELEKTLLSSVKGSFPDVNIVNFRIGYIDPQVVKNHGNIEYSEAMNSYHKHGYLTLTGGKYDQFHVIQQSGISRTDKWNHSSTSNIKDSFKSYMKSKKTNTKLISSFMSLIG